MEEAVAAFGPGRLLFEQRRQADPYPFLHRLREVTPVCWSPEFREWILPRWADGQAVLRDARFSSNSVRFDFPVAANSRELMIEAALARLEGEVAIPALLARFPRPAADDRPAAVPRAPGPARPGRATGRVVSEW